MRQEIVTTLRTTENEPAFLDRIQPQQRYVWIKSQPYIQIFNDKANRDIDAQFVGIPLLARFISIEHQTTVASLGGEKNVGLS